MCVVSPVELARRDYRDAARAVGTTPEAEETAILSVGREFLPAHARAVLDGAEETVEYYEWLQSQTEHAQREHDAEIAAGHEWHE